MGWTKYFRRGSWDAERRDEIDSYVQLEIDQNLARGMSRSAAEAAARRKLGNATQIREEIYGMNTISFIDTVLRDIRYAMRGLRRNRVFALIAILTLGLGIGASTAIFTVVNGVLLRPMPYPQPERLVRLWETLPKRSLYRNVVNPWNFLDWQARAQAFESMAAITASQTINLSGEGEPAAIEGAAVTTNLFDVLRVSPEIGRTFTSEEGVLGRGSVVILSHQLWQSRFGADRSVLGKKLILNGGPATVVGVMPARFSFPKVRAEIWLPLPISHSPIWQGGRSLAAVGRLKPGVTVEQADADLKLVASRLATERPDFDQDWSAEAVPILADTTGDVRTALLVLMAAVGFLLLIACSNVANLFLMRGAERFREISVRQTLGASRQRIFSQLMTESLIICVLAGAMGLGLGQWGLRAVLGLLQDSASLPRTEAIVLDWRVLACTLTLCFLTTMLFGLVPMMRIGRSDLQTSLRFRGRTASKSLRRAFVCTQVALALVLSVGAGLLARSFARLSAVNPGFDTERVFAMSLSPAGRYPDARARAGYFQRIASEVRNAPGVESVSTIQFLAMESESRSCFTPPADGPAPPISQQPSALFAVIGPDYFKTMGIPVERGRELDYNDRLGAPTAIVVNQAFAKKFYPGENPVGKKLTVCWTVENPAEIVGVSGDSRHVGMADAPEPTIFVANLQSPVFGNLIVRAKGDPAVIVHGAVEAIQKVNPNQAVARIRTLKQVVDDSMARPRFQSALMLVFAGVALLLASIGVYGVASYSVAQRTNEIGIRVAIGASQGDIARLILREGLFMCAIGLAAGLAAALGLTRFLASLLYEISPTDPGTLALVCGVLSVSAILALALPVRRARRVDPITALRYE